MKVSVLGLLGVMFCFSQNVLATPAEIILIRHGEKPDVGDELNEQGRERAKELVDFFLKDSRVLHFGTPAAIYAMKPKPRTAESSVRPIETVTPLAEKLHLKINTSYTKKQIEPLVKSILENPAYDDKMVLICWEHDAILDIVEEIGVDTPPAPEKWPGDVFDWAFIIDFGKRHTVKSFQNILQNLPMDSQPQGPAS